MSILMILILIYAETLIVPANAKAWQLREDTKLTTETTGNQSELARNASESFNAEMKKIYFGKTFEETMEDINGVGRCGDRCLSDKECYGEPFLSDLFFCQFREVFLTKYINLSLVRWDSKIFLLFIPRSRTISIKTDFYISRNIQGRNRKIWSSE